MRVFKRKAVILCVIFAVFGLLIFGAIAAGRMVPEQAWSVVSTFFLGFDAADHGSIVRDQIPIVNVVNSSNFVVAARNGTVPVAAIDAAIAAGTNRTAPPPAEIIPRELGDNEYPIEVRRAGIYGGIFINNETSFDVEVDDFLNRSLNLDFSVDGPTVLIIHAHTTEAFTPPGVTWYHIDNNKRSLDSSENVTQVGEVFLRVFRENGINAVHNTTVHDYPSFRGSYANMLATVERYLQRYPSIQLVLDVHRDAIIRDDGTKIKLLNEINERDVAQVMFVVGTNAGGLSHEHWHENLALVVQLQDRILGEHPSLARPINLRRERFNHHATLGSMLIEVGTSGNTLEEAILAAEYAAQSIAELLREL